MNFLVYCLNCLIVIVLFVSYLALFSSYENLSTQFLSTFTYVPSGRRVSSVQASHKKDGTNVRPELGLSLKSRKEAVCEIIDLSEFMYLLVYVTASYRYVEENVLIAVVDQTTWSTCIQIPIFLIMDRLDYLHTNVPFVTFW